MRPAWTAAFTPEGLAFPTPIPVLDEITPDWAWGGSTGRGVRVAVVDSGIEADHPALGGMVRGGVAVVERGGQVVYDDGPHGDDFGHGTACAGIIHSIAPEAELYSVKVLGPTLSGTGSAFAAGLRWAIEHQMHILNLSLGTTKREFYATLHELADTAYFKNTILVTAANNFPQPSFPSVYASVISVACHDQKDPFLFYYNPAPPVDFGAPGIDIQVPWRGGGYISTTGNSFAAPHISGIVALILSKHPGLTPFQVKTILRATAWNVRNHQLPRQVEGGVAAER
ncbi:MAG TPA: S8 family serine peptidase [Chloroflexota bacterium]|nr:S8 family serine peptidase [Chloroflexota bacterium]HZU05604.1 S8 family serine peptidase [Chloroflexota bacterium]